MLGPLFFPASARVRHISPGERGRGRLEGEGPVYPECLSQSCVLRMFDSPVYPESIGSPFLGWFSGLGDDFSYWVGVGVLLVPYRVSKGRFLLCAEIKGCILRITSPTWITG